MGQQAGALSTAAALVAAARADLERLDVEVGARVEAAAARWLGDGGRAFLALGRAWRERERAVVGALAAFEAALRSTERDNEATDVAQAAAFARYQQQLG
jgi:uncharacterized protein YukE